MLFLTIGLGAKNQSVKEVTAKKSEYLNTEFKLKGVIHKPDSTDSKKEDPYFYWLVDRADDSLEIHSDEKLEIDREYRIEGRLKEKEERLYFKVSDPECLDCEEEDSESSGLMIILIGAVVVLLAVILFILLRNNKAKSNQPNYPSSPAPPRGSAGSPSPPPAAPGAPVSGGSNPGSRPTDGMSTIAFTSSQIPKEPITDSSTIVMQKKPDTASNEIPGLFVLLMPDGEHEKKLQGVPTGLGLIATLGRQEVDPKKAASHLLVKHPTVSRKQAELIFNEGKLYLRNLSASNPSKINGRPLEVGSMEEVPSASKIMVGEIEITYKS